MAPTHWFTSLVDLQVLDSVLDPGGPHGWQEAKAWAVTSTSRVCVGPGVRHQRRDSNPVSAGQHAGVLATCRAPASLSTFGVLLYVRKQVRVVGDVQNVSIF